MEKFYIDQNKSIIFIKNDLKNQIINWRFYVKELFYFYFYLYLYVIVLKFLVDAVEMIFIIPMIS